MTDSAWEELRQWRRDIEGRLVKLETQNAIEAERYSQITKRLDKIDGALSKLAWLVIGGIVAAFVSFVVSGGLVVG